MRFNEWIRENTDFIDPKTWNRETIGYKGKKNYRSELPLPHGMSLFNLKKPKDEDTIEFDVEVTRHKDTSRRYKFFNPTYSFMLDVMYDDEIEDIFSKYAEPPRLQIELNTMAYDGRPNAADSKSMTPFIQPLTKVVLSSLSEYLKTTPPIVKNLLEVKFFSFRHRSHDRLENITNFILSKLPLLIKKYDKDLILVDTDNIQPGIFVQMYSTVRDNEFDWRPNEMTPEDYYT